MNAYRDLNQFSLAAEYVRIQTENGAIFSPTMLQEIQDATRPDVAAVDGLHPCNIRISKRKSKRVRDSCIMQ